MAGLGKLLHRVPAERGRITDVELVRLRMEHGEALVMLGRDDDVFHAGSPGQQHDILRVEPCRIKVLGKGLVLLHADIRHAGIHDPFTDPVIRLPVPGAAQQGVQAPVDEHAVIAVGEVLRTRGFPFGGRNGLGTLTAPGEYDTFLPVKVTGKKDQNEKA